MLTLLLVVCSLVIGFAGGFLLTMHKFYLPLKRTHQASLDFISEALDKVIERVGKREDGSVVSPIQIKR